MSVSEGVRALRREGLTTAEIARRLGVSYQHAYNVLKADRARPGVSGSAAPMPNGAVAIMLSPKPSLAVDMLTTRGFVDAGNWVLSGMGELTPDQPLPSAAGVYAFARDGVVQYVGIATMGLAKRLRFYGKPGATQRTNQRLNGIIKAELQAASAIKIYIALPPDLEWNGLPVHGGAGLELGLIRAFSLPWNLQGTG